MIEEEHRQNAQAQTPTAPSIPAASSNPAAANERVNRVLSSPAVSAAIINTPQSAPSALNDAQQHTVSNTANVEAQAGLATGTQPPQEADIADSPLSPRRIDTEMRVGIDPEPLNQATPTATAIELDRLQPASRNKRPSNWKDASVSVLIVGSIVIVVSVVPNVLIFDEINLISY